MMSVPPLRNSLVSENAEDGNEEPLTDYIMRLTQAINTARASPVVPTGSPLKPSSSLPLQTSPTQGRSALLAAGLLCSSSSVPAAPNFSTSSPTVHRTIGAAVSQNFGRPENPTMNPISAMGNQSGLGPTISDFAMPLSHPISAYDPTPPGDPCWQTDPFSQQVAQVINIVPIPDNDPTISDEPVTIKTEAETDNTPQSWTPVAPNLNPASSQFRAWGGVPAMPTPVMLFESSANQPQTQPQPKSGAAKGKNHKNTSANPTKRGRPKENEPKETKKSTPKEKKKSTPKEPATQASQPGRKRKARKSGQPLVNMVKNMQKTLRTGRKTTVVKERAQKRPKNSKSDAELMKMYRGNDNMKPFTIVLTRCDERGTSEHSGSVQSKSGSISKDSNKWSKAVQSTGGPISKDSDEQVIQSKGGSITESSDKQSKVVQSKGEPISDDSDVDAEGFGASHFLDSSENLLDDEKHASPDKVVTATAKEVKSTTPTKNGSQEGDSKAIEEAERKSSKNRNEVQDEVTEGGGDMCKEVAKDIAEVHRGKGGVVKTEDGAVSSDDDAGFGGVDNEDDLSDAPDDVPETSEQVQNQNQDISGHIKDEGVSKKARKGKKKFTPKAKPAKDTLSGTELKCPVCDKVFSVRSYLNRHVKIHLGVRPFQCDQCGKGFIRKVDLTRHLAKHELAKNKKHHCECGNKYTTLEQLERHKAQFCSLLSKQYSCEGCQKAFTTEELLVSHLCRDGGGNVPSCKKCGICFMWKKRLEEHEASHKDDEAPQCFVCKAEFGSSDEVLAHVQENHTDMGRMPFVCVSCKKHFRREKYLTAHKCEVYEKKRSDETHMCEVCGRTFATAMGYKYHQGVHSDEKNHECSTCGKKFHNETRLRRHSEWHAEAKHTCEDCGKSFKSSGILLQHRVIHTHEHKYQCTTCGKRFLRLSGLYVHRQSHQERMNYPCPECPKSFPTSTRLAQHSVSHDPTRREFECEQCGRRFGQRAHLNTHMLVHTGAKPFPCSVCNRAFARAGDLRVHMRRHTGDRPHACDMCHKSFTQAGGLLGHRKTTGH